MAMSFYKLGNDLQRLSESVTWAHYLKFHPQAKVGFHHAKNGVLFLTLTDRALGHHGVIKYAKNATELLEVAHLALWEQGEIEML
jgi:hypothetical protein